jgi:polyisoprenoid-binding protein YceI
MRLRIRVMALLASAGLVVGSQAWAAATAYKVDTVHSSLVFRIKHMNVNYFQGRFDDFSGTLSLDEQNPAQSSIEFKVNANSIDTANEKRDQHLKSPDFFNAKQFPTVSFKSKSVSKAEPNTYEVQGDLTLHGVTKPVTIRLEKTGSGPGMRGGTVAGFEAIVTIKRSDFGMSKMLEMLGDDVKITANLEAGGP